jgi:hypothetical protein
MRLKDDSTCKEDLQAGRAWGNLGFKIADAIDREMTSADGIARLERAADLMALADWAAGGAVELREVRIWQHDGDIYVTLDDPSIGKAVGFVAPGALEAAAAWCRQRGGA